MAESDSSPSSSADAADADCCRNCNCNAWFASSTVIGFATSPLLMTHAGTKVEGGDQGGICSPSQVGLFHRAIERFIMKSKFSILPERKGLIISTCTSVQISKTAHQMR